MPTGFLLELLGQITVYHVVATIIITRKLTDILISRLFQNQLMDIVLLCI